MPSFKCADLGMDCSFMAKSITKSGLKKKIQAHASEDHNITSIPDDLRAKVESAGK